MSGRLLRPSYSALRYRIGDSRASASRLDRTHAQNISRALRTFLLDQLQCVMHAIGRLERTGARTTSRLCNPRSDTRRPIEVDGWCPIDARRKRAGASPLCRQHGAADRQGRTVMVRAVMFGTSAGVAVVALYGYLCFEVLPRVIWVAFFGAQP